MQHASESEAQARSSLRLARAAELDLDSARRQARSEPLRSQRSRARALFLAD
jgi:hypothetical protein